MATKNQNGFTLIELILFLALSALFLIIALTGIRGRSGEVQLTDSVRSLESYLELQRDYILRGVNPLGGDSGGGQHPSNTTGGTIVLGRYFEYDIDNEEIDTYLIVGDRLNTSDVDSVLTTRQLIYEANPRITTPSIGSYKIEWGLDLGRFGIGGVNSSYTSDQHLPSKGFAFVRSPLGSEIIGIAFRPGNPIGNPATDPEYFNPNKVWGKNPPSDHDDNAFSYQHFSSHICLYTPGDNSNVVAAVIDIGDEAANRELGSRIHLDPNILHDTNELIYNCRGSKAPGL